MSKSQIGPKTGWFVWGIYLFFVVGAVMYRLPSWAATALFAVYVTAWALCWYAYRKSRA